ncbi:hypothetical protein CONPUDRAFT_145754 [Coniophora puteana RWD-64-598 SS2]|uniref:F-box domain-containing protein n=1 Tax=Coniophora puteana (strain RWD-64-598) TaxID=741705 RepID=A0A5M3MIY6_CONPW|nr:uncharacterized protein CONPUDRAFT_145754 [Coniophora puteana RWD-64-598 SS2]EIW78581.1 hypothetical protein CONPUDRAFT_145754 [Coniophora puteana RWD-64-598 SS2]
MVSDGTPSQHPSIPPIAFLSDDLLYDIFLICAGSCIQPDIEPNTWPFYTQRSPSWSVFAHHCDSFCWEWTRIMLVCRRWCQLMMSSGRVWVSPFFGSRTRRHAEKSLARVDDAPIIIRYAPFVADPWFAEFLRSPKGYFQCRQLLVEYGASQTPSLQDIVDSLPHSAPWLKVLALATVTTSNNPSTLVRIPEALLKGAPRLRTLALGGCMIESWKSFPCRDLTTLIIGEVDKRHDACPATSDTLALLKQTPHLQTLVIWGLDREEEHHHDVTDAVIALPSLSRIALGGTTMQALDVFDRLCVHQETIISLRMSGLASENVVSPRLAASLQRRYNTSSTVASESNVLPALRSVSISCTGDWLTIAGSVNSNIDNVVDADLVTTNSHFIHITIDINISDHPALATNVLRSLHLNSIISLSLSHFHCGDELSEWEPLWSTVPGLRVLHVASLSLVGTRTPIASLFCRELFGSLEELRLEGLNFDVLLVELMREGLKMRADRGHRLRLLRFDHCEGIAQTEVEELKRDGSVDEVVLEEVEEEFSDDEPGGAFYCFD